MANERLFILTMFFWGSALIFYVLNMVDYINLALCAVIALVGYIMEGVKMRGFGKSLFRTKKFLEQETVIARGATFTGNMHLHGILRIYGKVIGHVDVSEGVVYVMDGGQVEGEIQAPHLVLNGLLKGTCKVATVNILVHGCLQGDCHSTSLSIDKGGILIGHSLQLEEDKQMVRIGSDLPQENALVGPKSLT